MRKKNIIFVCTGNTCRSPMADIILKNKLKFAGLTGIRVWSAGLSATDGAKMSKNSQEALKLLGYKPYGFKSRQITVELIKKCDLVICMTENHKRALAAFDNVYAINELTGLPDITDPYGGNINVYVKTSHQIVDACDIILEKILKSQGE